MLYELADRDLTRIPLLRGIKKKILWQSYYLRQVEKLNGLIEEVEYIKYIQK